MSRCVPSTTVCLAGPKVFYLCQRVHVCATRYLGRVSRCVINYAIFSIDGRNVKLRIYNYMLPGIRRGGRPETLNSSPSLHTKSQTGQRRYYWKKKTPNTYFERLLYYCSVGSFFDFFFFVTPSEILFENFPMGYITIIFARGVSERVGGETEIVLVLVGFLYQAH